VEAAGYLTAETAAAFKPASICAGVDPALLDRYAAAAPATCGAAIEVPLIICVVPPNRVDLIDEPGALISTRDP
jgi:hypothetical protein